MKEKTNQTQPPKQLLLTLKQTKIVELVMCKVGVILFHQVYFQRSFQNAKGKGIHNPHISC